MNEIAIALELLVQAVTAAQQIGTIIQQAQAQNRTSLTPEEWKVILQQDDASRARLVAAITARMSAGAPASG